MNCHPDAGGVRSMDLDPSCVGVTILPIGDKKALNRVDSSKESPSFTLVN